MQKEKKKIFYKLCIDCNSISIKSELNSLLYLPVIMLFLNWLQLDIVAGLLLARVAAKEDLDQLIVCGYFV